MTVNALIVALERAQILLLVTGKQEASSYKINIMMNLLILTGPFLLAIWYPQVGTLAALGGSFATMLVIYFLPIITHLKYKYSSIKNPELAHLIKKSKVTKVQLSPVAVYDAIEAETNIKSPIASVLEVSNSDLGNVEEKDFKSEKKRFRQFVAAAIVGTLL